MKRITTFAVAVAATSLLLPHTSQAAARTWANSGTDYNAAASWNSGSGPAPGTGDVGLFNTAPTTQPNVSTSVSNAGVLFAGTGTSGYDLTGGAGVVLTLTGYSSSGSSGTSNSSAAALRSEATSGTNTIDVALALAPAGTPSGYTTPTSIFNQAVGGTLVVNGTVSGTTPLSLKGGTIQLNAANTSLTGGVSIDQSGTSVVLGNDSALGTGTFTVNNTSTVSGSSARALGNATVLAGTLTVGGSNAVTFNGSVTAAGAASRTLTVNNTATTTLAGNVFLSDASGTGRTLVINGTGNTVISGVIADFNGAGSAGTLSHSGTGTLTLSSANTYTGGTLMSGGTTIANHDGAFGSGNVSLTAGNVTLTLQNGAVNNYIADGASLSLLAGTDTVNLNYIGTDVVNTLTVAGVGEAAGVYGSAASGAPNVIAEFTGTGTITVLTSAIPEPTTSMLLGLGVLLAAQQLIRRRRVS